MILEKPEIFQQFPEIVFGLSKKYFQGENDKYNFNMSKSIGDNKELVLNNRAEFFGKLGLNNNNVIVQKQIHSDIINVVDKFTVNLEGDALITKSKNLGLAISTADCTNIYLYDYVQKIISAVHSGWMGTEKRILEKTLNVLFNQFNSKPEHIAAYFGPSICKENYEVGQEFTSKFSKEFMLPKNDKWLLDLKLVNRSMLLDLGVSGARIQISDTCSFQDSNYHSYRRDKKLSGRALGVIAIKE